jgi:hemin uptake protein HemP
VSSEWLFRDAGVVRIEHAGEVYMLRKTRSGKLILTK